MQNTGYSIRHNVRVKTYPIGGGEVLAASRPVFREPGWEQTDDWGEDEPPPPPLPPMDPEDAYAVAESIGKRMSDEDPTQRERDNRLRAMRRARSQLRDLALSNRFKWFVTLTLDAERIDRYDDKQIIKRLNVWLDNAVRRNSLSYILVPEHHKDGAVHFHGFFTDAVPVVDSGTVIPPEGGKPRKPRSKAQRQEWLENGGHVVYNLPRWGYGFSTAIELYGEYSAAVGYVCKYIGKEADKIGGRWYYHGGKLARPTITYADADFEAVAASEGAGVWESPTLPGVRFTAAKIE